MECFFLFSFRSSLFLHFYHPLFFTVPFLLYSYFPISFVLFLQPFTECDTPRVGRLLSYVHAFISLRFIGVPL